MCPARVHDGALRITLPPYMFEIVVNGALFCLCPNPVTAVVPRAGELDD